MIPDDIRERLDEMEEAFLERALELYDEQTDHSEPLLAGGIARSLKWRMTGAELNKFVRKLHSRGFVVGPRGHGSLLGIQVRVGSLEQFRVIQLPVNIFERLSLCATLPNDT